MMLHRHMGTWCPAGMVTSHDMIYPQPRVPHSGVQRNSCSACKPTGVLLFTSSCCSQSTVWKRKPTSVQRSLEQEVGLEEGRLAAVALRSKCRKLESESLFAEVFEKYEDEIRQLQVMLAGSPKSP